MHKYIRYKINGIRDECIDTKTFMLDKKLDAKPGQFVMLWLPGIGEKPISISFNNPLELTVKKFGPFTTELFKLKSGDSVWARGPYGNSFLDFVDDNSKKYLIAGGTGAAPLKFLVESLKHAVAQRIEVTGRHEQAGSRVADRVAATGRRRRHAGLPQRHCFQ